MEEMQWSNLDTMLIKTEDTLVETQDLLEEVNWGIDEEPKITYVSGLLLDKLKLKLKELLREFKHCFIQKYN